MALFELLYLSELSPTTSASAIAELVVQARLHNKTSGITGLLLFDGEHFIQSLEGEQVDVMALMNRIECDDRHFHVTHLHKGFLETRQFQNFAMGYWYIEDESSIMKLRGLRGQAAMDELRSRRGEFDVES